MMTRREGFTVVEVILSVMLLGIILTTLAGLTFTTARQSLLTASRSNQQALTLELVNRYAVLPWDSLTDGYSRVYPDSAANNWVRRHVGVTRSGNTAAVVVVGVSTRMRRDSTIIRFTRAAPVAPNPLWTP